MGRRTKIEVTPMGNKVKWRVVGRVMCNGSLMDGIVRPSHELRKSITLERTDWFLHTLFGSQRKTDAFLKRNRKRYLVVDLEKTLPYHCCDRVV